MNVFPPRPPAGTSTDRPASRSMSMTVRTRAANELRERIVTGDLPAGTVLDLQAITEEFGTSRTPVREALLELSHEGLVKIAPRSGVVVVGVTPHDISDSFDLLATLSGKAAEWATERMSDATLRDIVELHERAYGTTLSGPGDLAAVNWNFHRVINLAADSTRLLTLVRQTVSVVPRRYFVMFPEEEENAQSDHDELIEAFRLRDATRARTLNETHVAEAGRRIAEWIAARGRAGPVTLDPAGPRTTG